MEEKNYLDQGFGVGEISLVYTERSRLVHLLARTVFCTNLAQECVAGLLDLSCGQLGHLPVKIRNPKSIHCGHVSIGHSGGDVGGIMAV